MANEMHILIGLWILFFLLHSVLAALPIKNFLIQKFNWSPKTYRFQYVVYSLIHLVAILIFTITIHSNYLFQIGPWSNFIGLTLAALGVIIIRRAFKSYDGKAFLGLSDLSGEEMFKTDGLLKYVRHPLYSGTIVLLIGFLIYIPNTSNLISVSLMVFYFLVGIHFEEKKLIKLFGDQYINYRKNTPMLFPRVFK